jgi:hypothetical protein
MLTLKPNVECRELVAGDVGHLVQVDGKLALVTVAEEDPRKLLCLATFDPTSKMLLHGVYQGQLAVTFGGDFVFEPDISSIAEAAPTSASTLEVFFDKSEIYLVVHINSGNDWRLVSIKSGRILRWNARHMPVTQKWRWGVPVAGGDVKWLLQAP